MCLPATFSRSRHRRSQPRYRHLSGSNPGRSAPSRTHWTGSVGVGQAVVDAEIRFGITPSAVSVHPDARLFTGCSPSPSPKTKPCCASSGPSGAQPTALLPALKTSWSLVK